MAFSRRQRLIRSGSANPTARAICSIDLRPALRANARSFDAQTLDCPSRCGTGFATEMRARNDAR